MLLLGSEKSIMHTSKVSAEKLEAMYFVRSLLRYLRVDG